MGEVTESSIASQEQKGHVSVVIGKCVGCVVDKCAGVGWRLEVVGSGLWWRLEDGGELLIWRIVASGCVGR